MVQEIFQWLSAITAIGSAVLWVKSSVVSVPAPPETTGVGALIGGYVIGEIDGKRVDLPGTLNLQSKWNSRAALATAAATIFAGIALVPSLLIEAPQPQPKAVHTSQQARPYPQYVSTIPPAFRGGWDEMVTDGCRGREARYSFTDTTAANFEVVWNVTRIQMLSPVAMDLDVSAVDDKAGQVNDIWHVELVDNGRTLKFRKPDSYLYRKCPAD